MENIINTKEYMKVIKMILVAIAFAVSFPFVTFADTISEEDFIELSSIGENSGSNYPIGNDTGSNYPIGNDTGSTYPIGNDTGSNYPIGNDTGSTYPIGNDTGLSIPSGMSTVQSGTFIVREIQTAPSYYYPAQTSVVTSGGFIGGGIQTAPSTYYVPPTSTVTSGSFTGASPVYTQPTYTYTQPTSTYIPNQVLAYTDTNPNLDAIYLSDVPYTGLEDYAGIIIFISALLFWSVLISYLFLKKKMQTQMVFASVNTEDSSKVDPMISNIQTQISNDSEDIRKVEDYARMNKVLLSGDASAKIVKLSRLGQINASEYIRSVATGEWVAIGESQIS